MEWHENEESKETIDLPVSIMYNGKKWIICANSDTRKLLGRDLAIIASGHTKEDAVNRFYAHVRMHQESSIKEAIDRNKWFVSGDWKRKGGMWFSIFFLHVYIRYGKDMLGGWYIPFTQFNITVSKRY